MKHILQVLLFSLASLFGLMPLQAQWEKIGWQGGDIGLGVQLGNTLYGAVGNGFYKSTDFGKSWRPFQKGLPVSWLTFRIFNKLVVENDYLYLTPATNSWWPWLSDNGLYYCKEGDTVWSFKKLAPIPVQPTSYSSQAVFFDKDTIVASFTHNLVSDSLDGFFLSIDGGLSWQKRSGSFGTFRQNRTLFSIIYTFDTIRRGYSIHLLRTRDLGLTVDTLLVPWSDSLYANIYKLNDSVLFVTTGGAYDADSSEYLFRSTDQGTTWSIPGGPLPPVTDRWSIGFIKVIGKKSFMFAGDFNQGFSGLYESDDLGGNWKKIILQDSGMQLQMILGIDNNYILCYSQGCFRTDSLFKTLTRVHSNQALSNNEDLLYVSNTNLFVATIPNQGVAPTTIYFDSLVTSSDNGITWSARKILDGYSFNEVRWVKDGISLYASGKENKSQNACLFQSSDDGQTWRVLMSFPSKIDISQIAVHSDSMLVKIDSDGSYSKTPELWLSIDAGLSWIELSTPYSQTNSYFFIGFLNNFLMLNESYVSQDLGKNWDRFYMKLPPSGIGGLSIFGNRWFSWSQYDGPKYQRFFNTYYSTNQGSTWQQCLGLDSNLMSGSLSLNNPEKGIIFSSSFSYDGDNYSNNSGRNAFFYSRDSGNTWTQLGDYFTDATDFFSGSEYFFMAGRSELWRFPKSSLPLSVDKSNSIPSISIGGCYPNPSASKMRISYSIPKRSNVILSLFDITGKEITQVDSEEHDAGSYEIVWDSRGILSGSYVLKLSACGESVAKVIEVVK